jgi:citrate lyase beta subunit
MNAAIEALDDAPIFAWEKPMPRDIRRSLLALSIDDAKLSDKARVSWADAVILDFTRKVGVNWRADLQARMPAAVHAASRGGAEVFVRVNACVLEAELEAVVCHGVKGVVFRGVQNAADMTRAARQLDVLEKAHGIAAGALEIDVEVDTASAVWHSLAIARASDRFGAFIVDDRALCAALGMQNTPSLDFDPLEYIKSQLISVAVSVDAMAIGMSYPLSLTQGAVDDTILHAAVKRARDTGFKGALCPHASWVKACNSGFRPTEQEAAFYVKVVEVFADGVKRGMASVPLDGKMIDVPVDLRAKLYLKWARRAAARDAAKEKVHE